MFRVYVLNSSYQCTGQCSVTRALSLIDRGVAEVVKYSDKVIKTVTREIVVPLIIRLHRFVQAFGRRMRYSNRMVWERDDYRCMYCGKKIEQKSDLSTDHVVPRSRGGKTVFENMVTACRKCNARKDNRSISESGMRLLKKPFMPLMSRHMRSIVDQVGELLEKSGQFSIGEAKP